MAMFWSYASLEAWAKYRASRRRTFLITALLTALSALSFLVCHVIYVLK